MSGVSDTTTEPQPVPEGTRLLHIGPPKTGSTALQAAMHGKRAEMRAHGVELVASDQRGREAVWAALTNPDFDERHDPRLFRRWRKLLEEVEGAGGQRVCLSNESLAQLEGDEVRRMVGALGGERAHVVAAVRRLDRLLPSHWQEWVRIGSTSLTFEQWLEVVLGDDRDSRHWQEFWLPNDLEKVVDRWMRATARDRFTLIILDEGNPRLLSQAFERLLGLPDGLLKPEESHRRNASASMARVELVRRVNQALDAEDWPEEVTTALRSRVAKRIRSAPQWDGEAPIPPLPAWAAARVHDLNEQRAQLVESLGVQVIGDPAILAAPVPDAEGADGWTDQVSTELAAQSVVTAIGGAVELLAGQRPDRPRAKARPDQPGPASGSQALDRFPARQLARELRRRAVRRVLGRRT